ncbi:MAG: AAA family ATPase [Deltaproteobacteria bacterium]|nr:AAA family ATPase [Deltaproteobacteria bacterium]
MELKLPLIVDRHSARHVEMWLPAMPEFRTSGGSAAELRDDLALMVMDTYEHSSALEQAAFALPPHMSLRQVRLDSVARDPKRGRKAELKGMVSVFIEKWPKDDFFVVTPIRLPEARFALASLDSLPDTLARRLGKHLLATRAESLESCVSRHRERLDILEVDVYPSSVLPRLAKRTQHKPRAAPGTREPETPLQKEERRRRRRLTADTLRTVCRNLSHAAQDDTLERCLGREALVRQLVSTFEAREGLAVCLVGPSGAGKTALVHEFTRRLHVAYSKANQRRDVWRVDGNRFIAGMSYVGQWEARAQEMLRELSELGDVLYLDDLASMAFAGQTRQGKTHVAQYMEPALSGPPALRMG